MKDDSKKVYILLSKTKTVPSNLIKLMTREPYCHTSLALDISLDEMYSFARKGVYNPFNSGFISENIEKGIFGKHKGTRCAVYELKVTSKQYDRIQQELARFKKHPDRYGYNFMPQGHPGGRGPWHDKRWPWLYGHREQGGRRRFGRELRRRLTGVPRW